MDLHGSLYAMETDIAHVARIHFRPVAPRPFPEVDIPGSVAYLLWYRSTNKKSQVGILPVLQPSGPRHSTPELNGSRSNGSDA